MLTQFKKRYKNNSESINKIQRILAYFKYAFFILLLSSFFTGFSPLHIINKFLFAEDEKIDTINFYAFKTDTDSIEGLVQTGWHSNDKALSFPEMGPKSKMLDFSADNSAFYAGGRFSLELSGFKFLLSNEIEEEISSSTDNDLENKKEIKEEEEEDYEIETGKEATSSLSDDFNNVASSSEYLEEEMKKASSSEDFLDAKEASSSDGDLYDDIDNDIENEIESEMENKVNDEEDDLEIKVKEEEREQADVEIIENDNSEMKVIIKEEDNLDLDNDLEEEEDFSIQEPKVEEDVSGEVKALEDDGAEISFWKKIKNNIHPFLAQAQEFLSSDIKKASDLGEFKNAKIKFSLALREKMQEDIEIMEEMEVDTDDEVSTSSDILDDNLVSNGDENMVVPDEVATSGDSIIDDEETSPDTDLNTEDNEDMEMDNETENNDFKNEDEKEMDENEDEENNILSFINKAQAEENEGDAKIIIWYALKNASSSEDEDFRLIWKKLDTLSAHNLSNYLNKGYLTYDADFLSSWEDVENLQLKFEGLLPGKADFFFYLDSAWVEVEYDKTAELERLKRRERWENALKLLSGKTDFSLSDPVEFRFQYNKNEDRIWDTLGEMMGIGNFWKDVYLEVELITPDGKKSKEELNIIFEEDGEFLISLNNKDRKLKPGKYTFLFHIKDNSGEDEETFDIEKSFTWGVLAMNFDKSVYEINDAGEISMAVLNSEGHTICDAELSLEITKPDGDKVYYSTEESTTTNGVIIKNPNCGPDNVEHRPDYYLNYNFSEEGFYNVVLKARYNNSSWEEISEKIEARERVPFILKRTGPTRIYPRANYEMVFDLIPRETYEGDFIEYVPSGFDIVDWSVKIASGTEFIDYNDYKNLNLSSSTDLIIKTDEEQKKLIWTNLKVSPSTRFKISYTFDAPNISPELYLLGPAEIENFKEARQWQIAADAQDSFRVTEYYISSGFTGTTYELTLDNDLSSNHYILVRGSSYLDGTRGADDNYVRVYQLPDGMNGELATSSGANKIGLERYGSDGDWEGVVTVVESLGDSEHSGFIRRDIINLTTSGTGTSGTDNSGTEWASSSKVVLFGGAFGAGSNVEVADASAYYHTSAWLRLWPTSTSTINWERYDGGGRGLQTAEHTVYVIEWGDEWKVQHVNVNTSAGGDGIDATSEYTTASIDSVVRANTWVWGTGHRQDDGIGDGAEAMAITLGDGTSDNATESTVALGSEYTDIGSFDVYVMTHSGLAVDYQFKIDGDTANNDVNVGVDSASDGYRMAWVTNGVNGTGNAYPRPIFSAHYTSDTNVLISRGYDGQDFPAWIEGIDFSGITYNIPPTGTFNSSSEKTDASGAIDVSIEIDDDEDDDIQAKIEYVAGDTCDFSSPLDPTLDETDANTTADFGDPSIENDDTYQIGTGTEMILTSSGSNTVNFDWLSSSDVVSSGTIYCLRLTANDGTDDQTTLATTTVYVDNVAPTAPGSLSFNARTGTSITLNFGATTTEENFSEYKIFYKEYDGSDPTESDSLYSSTTDANLGNILFNSKATTTISGLTAGTKYSFAIWAYDDYGYKASSSRVDIIANDAPLGSFNSAQEKTDASGDVSISIEVDDLNNDDTNVAKIEYVAGDTCDFSSPLDPSLDASSISADFGTPVIDNNETYQVGSSSGYIITSPGSNTIGFDWQTKSDLPSADGTYCLRLTVNDGVDDQADLATTTVIIDNVNPNSTGNLSYSDLGINSIRLIFATSSPATDTNEPTTNAYKIFYKKGTSGVTESDTEYDLSALDAYDYNGATSSLLSGLDSNTDYVFNIWTYDAYGNKSSATEFSVKTNSTLVNESLALTNATSSNIILADNSTEWNFRAVVSETNGWYALDNVVLRLADGNDATSPFGDLEFTWDQSNNDFSETGTDNSNAVVLSTNSTSTCAVNTCTLNFKIIVNKDFSLTSVDYSAELYSTNDSSVEDEDTYADIYEVRKTFVKQIHYRWRNDDGGE